MRITVTPEDFPFLPQVGGHDDSELINLGALGQQITQATTAANLGADCIGMKLAYTPELGETILQYIPLAQKFIPTARFVWCFEPEAGVWLDMFGPPAVMQVMRDRVEKHLASLQLASSSQNGRYPIPGVTAVLFCPIAHNPRLIYHFTCNLGRSGTCLACVGRHPENHLYINSTNENENIALFVHHFFAVGLRHEYGRTAGNHRFCRRFADRRVYRVG